MDHYKNLSLENIDGEVWVDISGYIGYYQVSNYSRVKSLRRKVCGGNNILTRPEKIKKQIVTPFGYLMVGLSINNKKKRIFVHVLAARAFIPNPKNKRDVNHKNGNKKDNNLYNLEWATRSENVSHAYRTGLATKITGENHYNCKITDEQVRQIRLLFGTMKQGALAAQFGVSRRNISMIMDGKSRVTA